MKPLYQFIAAVAITAMICILGWPDEPLRTPIIQPTEPLVETAPKLSPQFLFISDIHYGSQQVNVDGDYSTDTGPILWQAAQNEFKSILNGPNAPAFVVYTGDLPAHYQAGNGQNNTCKEPLAGDCLHLHEDNIEKVLDDLYAMLPAGIPLFYAPGNNDALAGDYYSFANAQDSTPFSLVPATDHYPSPYANTPCGSAPCMVSNPNPEHGYYAAKATEHLRIVALNSVILGDTYHDIDGVAQKTAGNAMMTWFAGQLDDAASAGDYVYIIMHIPPNKWKAREKWKYDFLRHIEKHQDKVAGILYGHTHMDEQLVFYGIKDPSKVTEVGISSPGITPLHANNPGFKTVTFDPNNMELKDFVTHWTTPGATTWGSNQYSFLEMYGQKGQATIYDALGNIDNFNSDSILVKMKQIYWVMNTDTAGSGKYFPKTVDVR